jgi:hypothetical protein
MLAQPGATQAPTRGLSNGTRHGRSRRSLWRRIRKRFTPGQIRHFFFVLAVIGIALGSGYMISRCEPTPAQAD